MKEKIPQHSHCRQCGRAFIGDEKFCSDECEMQSKGNLKKRKRQLIFLYAITTGLLIVALLAMGI